MISDVASGNGTDTAENCVVKLVMSSSEGFDTSSIDKLPIVSNIARSI